MTVGYLVGAVIMIGLVIAVVAASVRGRRWYRYTPQTARSDVGWSPDTESTDDTGGMLSRPTVWIAAFFVVTTVSIAGIFFVATGSSIASMTTLMFGALAALLVVYMLGGIYLVARGRGHSSAMAVAESATASGVLLVLLVAVQLVALG